MTNPSACAGVVTTTEVPLVETMVAVVPPKVTELVPDKFVPVIVTVVPPAVVPTIGDKPEIVGAANTVSV